MRVYYLSLATRWYFEPTLATLDVGTTYAFDFALEMEARRDETTCWLGRRRQLGRHSRNAQTILNLYVL